MRLDIKKPFLIIQRACWALTLAGIAGFVISAGGQTLGVLHDFTNTPDGANPRVGMISSNGFFYGTTQQGGASGTGTVFRINPDGTGLTNLYNFSPLNANNTDGAYPALVLVLAGNCLYGASFFGGSNGQGTVFMVMADGSGFSNLYTFSATSGSPQTNSDGAGPSSSLLLSGEMLYGATSGGGSSGVGTVYAIATNGAGFTNLHSFSGGDGGEVPQGGLVFSGTTLYGTTSEGGLNSEGMVFSMETNGAGFSNIYSFPPNYTGGNGKGAFPNGTLILSGNTLYGMAQEGGSGNGAGSGTIFSLYTNGMGFTNLHSFNYSSDGANSLNGLTLAGGVLYGTAPQGGAGSRGTVFCLSTNGSFTNLHNFSAVSGAKSTNSDGANPYNTLLIASNSLYGMASYGGTAGNGTLFRLLLPGPTLNLTPASATNVILTWPANDSGFVLQTTTNLAASVWTNVPGNPTVVNGQNTVTNSIYGTQQFFRLSY
jgi:uncharacterized repeat protein (TIGR03803 family)